MKKPLFNLFLIILIMLTGCSSPAGDYTDAKVGIRIAIIDSGISSAAIDNSFIGTGRNYMQKKSGTEDTIGHGTKLAGIIVGSDPAGISPLCGDVYLIPLVCSFADENGKESIGHAKVLAKAIRDAVDDFHCSIILVSAGTMTDNGALRRACAYAVDKNVLIIASAGNDGDSGLYYPAAYEGVCSVGAANADLTGPADFSSFGSTVDYWAPGVNIPTPTMKGSQILSSGTSYSAAYVAGLAASIAVQNVTIGASAILEQLDRIAQNINGYSILF